MASIFEDFCRHEAARRGIDPNIAVQAANTEGGLVEAAKRGTFNTGSSWWAFQLHYGGAGYEQYGTTAGMGNSFTAKTGWKPGDPLAWRDAMRYALDEIKRVGWSKWYGPATIGITGMRGVDPNFFWAGTPAHEWDFITGSKAPMPKVAYNPQEPAHPQDKSYDCSQESAEWAMWSLGRKPQDGWMEATMIAEGVMSPDQGLLDGSGAGLAAFIVRQYGEDGFLANNEPSVSWDWIVAEGGHAYPVLAGGHGFGSAGHWIGVKGYDAARGVLLIANPADGYTGIGQEMTQAQWEDRGPWSAVRIWHPDLFAEPAPPPVVVPSATLDRAAVAEKVKAIIALMDAQNAALKREMTALLAQVESA